MGSNPTATAKLLSKAAGQTLCKGSVQSVDGALASRTPADGEAVPALRCPLRSGSHPSDVAASALNAVMRTLYCVGRVEPAPLGVLARGCQRPVQQRWSAEAGKFARPVAV